jgi:thiamine biosynthesis lipoprotein
MTTYRIPFEAMAAGCELVIAGVDEEQAKQMAEAALAEVRRIETRYSRYRSDSVVSRINAAAGSDEAVPCDDETWALLEYADKLYRSSGGLFDITSGVLRRVWNFREARVPTLAELAEVCSFIDWAAVERSEAPGEKRVRLLRAGMELDFGGFGKEYAADRAGSVLAGLGLKHGYVNLAGDMRVLGPKPDGTPWMIGIQDPRDKAKVVATIPVDRGGLATSGDYERYFELNAQRYCHVLNPRSGMPVTHWRTVSVVAPLAVVAGSCTTIAMLKQAEGLEFLRASGLSYLAVDSQGDIHTSSSAKA